MARGYIFYCDGAGGGSLITNRGTGVREGMRKAGYQGSGENFPWQTRWGIVADQKSSVEYKRRKAARAGHPHRGIPQTVSRRPHHLDGPNRHAR